MGKALLSLTFVVALATSAAAQTKPPTLWRPASSSNYTTVNYNRGIRYVVIHTIEGSALGAVSWFQNPASRVSAHYVVSYGGTIYQAVADKNTAWHAGNSYYNLHSIGIEHEGIRTGVGGTAGWPDVQVGDLRDEGHDGVLLN